MKRYRFVNIVLIGSEVARSPCSRIALSPASDPVTGSAGHAQEPDRRGRNASKIDPPRPRSTEEALPMLILNTSFRKVLRRYDDRRVATGKSFHGIDVGHPGA